MTQYYNKRRTTLFLILVISLTLFISCKAPTYTIQINDLKTDKVTTKYGHLKTPVWTILFQATGYDLGDMVKVTFLDQELIVPVVSAYEQIESGKTAVVLHDGIVQFSINMGSFTDAYGIATKVINEDKSWYWVANEGITFPITFKISMYEKGGYLEDLKIFSLERSNNRNDYKNLSDEEYANFRKVNTTNMHNLYRSSNPVNSEIARNKYADEAFKKAGITVVLNLADQKEVAEARAEYKNTYYSTCNVKYLNLGVDTSSPDFKKGLSEGFKFLASNKGIYAVHCTEGKDRAGFVNAILECLMGASAQEVADDYMVTYYNYYNIEKGTEQYNKILSTNIVKTLQNNFEIEDFWTADLKKEAEEYLRSIGLTKDEINLLKANL